MTAPDLKTRKWQTFRAAMIDILPDRCSLCGKHVDKGLPGTHPMGPTIDHRIPRSRGGSIYDPSNCALAHHRCNSAKGGKTRTTPRKRSRAW